MQSTLTSRIAMALLLTAASLLFASDVAGAQTRPPPQNDGDVVKDKQTPAAHPHVAQKKHQNRENQQRVEPQPPASEVKEGPQRDATRENQPRVVVQQPQPRPVEPQSQPRSERTRTPTVVVQPKPAQERQPVPSGQRLSEPRHKQLVADQQRRLTQYNVRLETQQRVAQQRTARLQQQNRMAQYRFQEEYLERLREQQARLLSARDYDYNTDPYFYTPSSYRYSRGGRSYETNQYGADLLQQAVNNGYQEGYRAGLADREDRWGYSYRDSYAYQDANYGYGGFYVDQDAYNYYFREGFRRGYDDSYYTRNRYGSNTNGTFAVLGEVLSGILNLHSMR
jgi:hypothetical protein